MIRLPCFLLRSQRPSPIYIDGVQDNLSQNGAWWPTDSLSWRSWRDPQKQEGHSDLLTLHSFPESGHKPLTWKGLFPYQEEDILSTRKGELEARTL